MRRLSAVMMVLAVVMMLGFSGCGGFLGDGRMDKWAEVRKAEEETKQEVAKTLGKEADAKKSSVATQNPTLKLTAYDANGKITSVAEMDLQPVIAEVTGGRVNTPTSTIPIETTPMPRGEFAENFEAAANGTAKVLSSPGTIALGLSYNERKRDENSGDTSIAGETINLNDSLNRNELHNTGYGNALDFKGTAEPTVVEVPTPVE